jgi:formamidopyrimidine-DNA glycosylase
MPELPEVHTITQDLKKYVEGAQITRVEIKNNYKVLSPNASFLKDVENTKIIKISRIAKNILMELSSEKIVVIHLAMTGKLLLRSAGYTKDGWERVVFYLKKSHKEFELRFCDMRMFGKVQVIDKKDLGDFTKKYGPELIDEQLTPEEFLKRLQSKKSNIKNVLLEQSIVSGLGNVYAIDALWMAQIHPQTNTKNLNIVRASQLLNACREILKEGIANRGISMSDYVDLLGKKGFQQNHFRIYRQDKCPRCKNEIDFVKLGGRGTYFCAVCQT